MRLDARHEKEKSGGVLLYDGRFRRIRNEADEHIFRALNTRGGMPVRRPFEQDQESPAQQ
jgi:hypothetical protein